MLRSSAIRRRHDWAPWALAALGCLFFVRPLLLGWTFYFRDLHSLFLPLKEQLADRWHAHELALWNPYLHGGMPLLGSAQAASFYPTSLLYLLLPAVRAFNLELAMHAIGAGLAAYALARTLGLARSGAWTTGMVYGFCGVTLSQLNTYHRLLAMPFLPLLLIALHRHESDRSSPWPLMAGAVAGLQLLTGSPEMPVVTWTTALLWMVSFPYASSVGRRLLDLGRAATLGVAASAVQLLPLLARVGHSGRNGGFSYAAWADWSVPWLRLPELLVPGYLGRVDALDVRGYSGWAIIDHGFPLQASLYFGIPVLALAAASLTGGSGALPRRVRCLLLALAAVATVLAIGRHLPGFELLYRGLPPLRIVRYPEKLLLFAVLPVALGAGWTVHRIVRGDPHRVRRVAGGACAVAAVVCGAASAWAARGHAAHLLLSNDDPAADAHLMRVLILAAALGTASALALWQLRGRRLAGLLAAIVTADLLAAGRGVNPVTPAGWFLTPPPALADVRQATAGGRLASVPHPREPQIIPADADAAWGFRRDRFVFAGFLGAAEGVPVVFHDDFDGLAPPATVELAQAAWSAPWARRMPLLSAAAVKTILGAPGIQAPGLEPVGSVADPAGTALVLYGNRAAAPRFHWVGVWHVVAGGPEALRSMLAPGFDSRRHVVVEDAGRDDQGRPCAAPAWLHVTEPTPDRASITVGSSCPGYLVIADSWDSGWRYRVDGAVVAAVHADLAFAAVPLPAGVHRVERRYRPVPLAAGAVISSLAWLSLGALALRSRARRKRERSPAAGRHAPSACDGAPRP